MANNQSGNTNPSSEKPIDNRATSASPSDWFINIDQTLNELKIGTKQNQVNFNSLKNYIENLLTRTLTLEQKFASVLGKEDHLAIQLQEANQETRKALAQNKNIEKEMETLRSKFEQQSSTIDTVQKFKDTVALLLKRDSQLAEFHALLVQSQDKLQKALLEKEVFREKIAQLNQESLLQSNKSNTELKELSAQFETLKKELSDRNGQAQELKRRLDLTTNELANERKKSQSHQEHTSRLENKVRQNEETKLLTEEERKKLNESTAKVKRLESLLQSQTKDIENLRHINQSLKSRMEKENHSDSDWGTSSSERPLAGIPRKETIV